MSTNLTRIKQSVIAGILALTLVVGLTPFTAFADESETNAQDAPALTQTESTSAADEAASAGAATTNDTAAAAQEEPTATPAATPAETPAATAEATPAKAPAKAPANDQANAPAEEKTEQTVWLRQDQSQVFDIPQSSGDPVIIGDSSIADVSVETVDGAKKLTITGKKMGQIKVEVGPTTYTVNAYSYHQIRYWEINGDVKQGTLITTQELRNIDPEAMLPVELPSGYNFDSYESNIPAYDEIGGYWVHNIYCVEMTAIEDQTGNSTLTSEPASAEADYYYGARSAIAEDGSNLLALIQGRMFMKVSEIVDGIMQDKLVRVWCIEPTVSTRDGSKYDSQTASDELHEKAALIAIFGPKDDALSEAVIQAMIWEIYGGDDWKDASDNLQMITPSGDSVNVAELTEEEKERAANIKRQIETAIDIYKNETDAGFFSETPGVEVKNGTVTITKAADGSIPSRIKLHAGNERGALMLERYANGAIDCAPGITATVENDRLILDLDADELEDGATIGLSMIAADNIFDSVKFVSNYQQQTVMSFGITDPHSETLTLSLVDPEPTDDPDPDPSDDPADPTEPTTPSDEPKTTTTTTTTVTKTVTNTALPQTGDDMIPVAAIAAIILLAGGGLILARRKK